MSHVVEATGIEVRDLLSLKLACDSCGVELRHDQKTYRTYAGQTKECDAAIVHKSNKHAYEVGVVNAGDGTYKLMLDNWNNGEGMNDAIGRSAGKLLQCYTAQLTKRTLQREGWRVREKWEGNELRLTATR